MRVTIHDMLRAQLAFLFFRPIQVSLKQSFWPWLTYVLVVTGLVGIGRYWDHPSAEFWQYLGLGSVAYIFCLSAMLYIFVSPLRPANWDYERVLVFVGLTSLPAALYAIPVERFVSVQAAQAINAWFLGAVALWRVALLLRYLTAVAKLHWFTAATVTVMMLSGIVVTLSLLNLEHVVFSLMAGIREEDVSPNDLAYSVVLVLALISVFVFPGALFIYLVQVHQRKKAAEKVFQVTNDGPGE